MNDTNQPDDDAIRSRIAILQHPLHPMVVVFPIAFLMSTGVTDLVFWWRGDPFWALASFWLCAAGFASGVLAAVLGISDFLLVREARTHIAGWSHFLSGIMTVSLAGASLLLRFDDPVGAVLPWGLFVSAMLFVVVGVTGWLGGTLTFRHRIGTYAHAIDRLDPAEAPLEE